MAQPKLTRPAKPILVHVLAATAALAAGCGDGGGSADIAGKSIRYQVEFYGSPQTGIAHRAVTISYSTSEGLQEQHNVGLPWTTTVGTAGRKFTPSVTAQFYGFGTIVCRILADDALVTTSASQEAPYPTVECKA